MPTDILDAFVVAHLKRISTPGSASRLDKTEIKEGVLLVDLLNGIPGTTAERIIAGYLQRASQTLDIASKNLQQEDGRQERVYLAALLIERLALETLLKLEDQGGIRAIARVRQCAHCKRWFWSKLKNQRYCCPRCRIRGTQTSPRGKQYKREWARKKYHQADVSETRRADIS